ncbi:hypothetical protein [Erythrobacter mangrovi]|uniref:Lipoprotein n=1 Tax=Erythrobacter mangrovi TaxID=2739433 RepID=A0A7D3XHD5_9SPHN|nr:hypothetical protein [Erythrobacter mangrovi]QKG70379.1 hypothetical protein HQR01_02760 [Erythrobacter mangrovi]
MIRVLALVPFVLLAACKPPASDEYVERSRIVPRTEGPSEPLDSPDTTGAIWAPGARPDRLLYGKPGERPLMAIECIHEAKASSIAYTRFAPADPHAKAVLALIGNSHVSRLKIDAVETDGIWIWQAAIDAVDPALDVLTGTREVEATVPGAGTVVLNPSQLPGDLIEQCRAQAAPAASENSAPSPREDPA